MGVSDHWPGKGEAYANCFLVQYCFWIYTNPTSLTCFLRLRLVVEWGGGIEITWPKKGFNP